MRPTRPAIALVALTLVLSACSGGGESQPLGNDAADAGNGIAEVYGDNGQVLADGGASRDRSEAPSSINQTEPLPPVAGGPVLSSEQIAEHYSDQYTSCMGSGDAVNGVTSSMADCIAAELKVQDARLNAAYESAMGKRDEAGQTALRTEERAWIKTRDAKCRAMMQGGTIDMIQVPGCILEETVRRRIVLQPMAE